MPRIARTASPEVGAAIIIIKAFCQESGTNINALASSVGVEQSALSRFMNGERKTVTDAAKKTLRHVDSWHNRHKRSNDAKISFRRGNEAEEHPLAAVEEAVHNHWDGTRRGAELLAALIRAVAPLLHLASSNTKNSETSPR